ncbi:hypothetical protein BIW11_05650 [Tropilaelaps mercedesae]|uniref:Uncharacterized protein n=1 Tax=Tropilaelaps mercedesae TaxID=418985 RepID=A0A1V9Y1G7_9ACAR|nr:hypothetical protein BIW11_05650 [Tropilaelaps mercedesae]
MGGASRKSGAATGISIART